MENFIFQNPVKLIMGKGMIARLAKEIPSDKRIMITFGNVTIVKASFLITTFASYAISAILYPVTLATTPNS